MDIFHKESFGPVAPVCKVNSFEEAVALANDSKYGLEVRRHVGEGGQEHVERQDRDAGQQDECHETRR